MLGGWIVAHVMRRKALNNLPKSTRKQPLRSNWMDNVNSLRAHWALTIHKHRHSMFLLGCMWTADQWTRPNVTLYAAVAFHVRARLSAMGVNTLSAHTSAPLSWCTVYELFPWCAVLHAGLLSFCSVWCLKCSYYPCPRSYPVRSCLAFGFCVCRQGLALQFFLNYTFYRCFRSVPGIIKSNQH